VPQIEVAFDIDANGILHVSAKDKATGKSTSIQIKASSGLTDAEIQQMVKDAEAHADEDRKFHDLVNTRNQADAMVHAVTKSLAELGDKVEADEKKRIEDALEAVKQVMKSDDKDDIEAKTKVLTDVSGKLAERVYAQKGADAGEQPQAEPEQGGAKAENKDDVVDAEFEEVKDK
jgi:molecular chaperone DnaK